MGRKAKYCVFHSLEGSGNQNRNNEQCGLTEDVDTKTEGKPSEDQVTCKAFRAYGPVSKEQRKEISVIQKMASEAGLRKEFTLRKIIDIHGKNNWDWSYSNNYIKELLQSYPMRFNKISGESTEEKSEIVPFFQTEMGPVLTVSSNQVMSNNELHFLAETCKVQLTSVLKTMGEKSTLFGTNQDLLYLNFFLECAVTSCSIPHFQQALRLFHANMKPKLWKDKDAAIGWLIEVNNLTNVPGVLNHINQLPSMLDFCDDCESDDCGGEGQIDTCCSPGSACCNYMAERHQLALSMENVTALMESITVTQCVQCVCSAPTKKSFCYCKLTWVNNNKHHL